MFFICVGSRTGSTLGPNLLFVICYLLSNIVYCFEGPIKIFISYAHLFIERMMIALKVPGIGDDVIAKQFILLRAACAKVASQPSHPFDCANLETSITLFLPSV